MEADGGNKSIKWPERDEYHHSTRLQTENLQELRELNDWVYHHKVSQFPGVSHAMHRSMARSSKHLRSAVDRGN
jgi:hypothetical protein